MSTPKSTRAAPPRRFRDYIFTRAVSHDLRLSDVSNAIMTHLTGTAGSGYGDDDVSSSIDIGFEFQFNETVYTKFVICTNGFMVLLDPAYNTFVSGDILTSDVSSNQSIRRPFLKNHVLLAPWFDNLLNVTNSALDIYGAGAANTKAKYGIAYDSELIGYDAVRYGIKYHVGQDPSGRRRLVVRWFSHSFQNWTNNPGSEYGVITFEAVLYADGTIEYRYAPMNPRGTGVNLNSTATCGMFLSGTTDFRDFAGACGYLSGSKARSEAPEGAFKYDPGYTDPTYGTIYSSVMRADLYWPAGVPGTGQHTVFRMSPPQNRRRELPRNVLRIQDTKESLPTVARTSDLKRTGIGKRSLFNDQLSVSFTSGTIMSMPSGMPVRFAQGSLYAGLYNDLYLSGGITITSSVSPSSIEQYVSPVDVKRISPFTDNGRPEQGMLLTSYYGTGSNIGEFGDSLLYPLQSKTQIKFSLPITKPTTMLEYTSSMYYYNRKQRSWFMPVNTNGKDLASSIGSLNKYWPEDARGFDPVGNVISSGSRVLVQQALAQTSPNWGPLVFSTPENRAIALTGEYPKSTQINAEYSPTNDELFTLPISQPFLIEKAVIEMPFQAGPGWFSDKTTCGFTVNSYALSQYSFDFAGPGITIALYNNRSSPVEAYNDLILSSTIIPHGDSYKNVKAQYIASNAVRFTPEGFPSFNATPGTVVVPDANNQFTGSITNLAVAGVSNGVVSQAQNSPQTITANHQRNFIMSEFMDMTDKAFAHRIYSVNTFGRSSRGFDPSGRSTFGKEYVTFESTVTNGKTPNPLFVSSSFENLPQHIKQVFEDAAVETIRLEFAIPLQASYPSPYLVMPGDKLFLALSKMRPVLYGDGTEFGGLVVQNFTGSGQHDVVLPTGNINITLYGSLLREGREYHNGLNQELTSDAIHEALGSEPVVDQFDVEYRGLHVGGMADDYVTGSLVSQIIVESKKQLITGSRGRVFSKYFARNQSVPESSPVTSAEVINNPSKSFRTQPWYERVGGQYGSPAIAFNERTWDSLMPSLVDCLKVDGTVPVGGIHNISEVFTVNRFNIPTSSESLGRASTMFFNRTASEIPYVPAHSNRTWSWAYPFEPKYLHVARQPSVDDSTKITVNSAIIIDGSSNTVIAPVVPVTSDLGFYPLFFGGSPTVTGIGAFIPIDAKLNSTIGGSTILSCSLNSTDMIKVMYGFGDVNSMMYSTVESDFMGHNHQPEFRDQQINSATGVNYVVGPVIRGWKFGVSSGVPEYSKVIFRQQTYGQFRDVLEQRLFTKFYQPMPEGGKPANSVLDGPVHVKFVDQNGNTTPPERTWSCNLSVEATASVPYVDGEMKNRGAIDVLNLNLNTSVISFV